MSFITLVAMAEIAVGHIFKQKKQEKTARNQSKRPKMPKTHTKTLINITKIAGTHATHIEETTNMIY